MRTTIDLAGRVVIPKALRDELGLAPGEVELTRDGAGVRIEPVPGHGTVRRHGRSVIDPSINMTDEEIRSLRLSDQK